MGDLPRPALLQGAEWTARRFGVQPGDPVAPANAIQPARAQKVFAAEGADRQQVFQLWALHNDQRRVEVDGSRCRIVQINVVFGQMIVDLEEVADDV